MFRSSKTFTSLMTSKGKKIAVDYVTKTDAWERTHLDQSLQTEYQKVAEKYKDTLKSDTEKLAMKEAEHPSQRDPKTRFSVFELDKNDKVLAVRHMYP